MNCRLLLSAKLVTCIDLLRNECNKVKVCFSFPLNSVLFSLELALLDTSRLLTNGISCLLSVVLTLQ